MKPRPKGRGVERFTKTEGGISDSVLSGPPGVRTSTMLLVGLTGGVASGKSTVSRIFEEEGAAVIDADQIARDLVEPGTPAFLELVRTFGKNILRPDGSIDRKSLAGRIFSDPQQRDLLNRILHPRIDEEIRRRIEEVFKRDPGAVVVIDAALLIEVGNHGKMDKVIVVTSEADQQIQRLKDRDGLAAEEARKILASQMPQEEKLKLADYVLRNEGSLEETEKRTREVFRELKKIAHERNVKPYDQIR
jgi:dephospho-CoA kinase